MGWVYPDGLLSGLFVVVQIGFTFKSYRPAVPQTTKDRKLFSH